MSDAGRDNGLNTERLADVFTEYTKEELVMIAKLHHMWDIRSGEKVN